MLLTITQPMMEDYVLNMLKEQFKSDKEIIAEINLKRINPDTKEIVSGCSYILIVDIGIIYYSPLHKTCFYEGTYPGSYFFGITHFRLKRDFKSLLPFIIERLLIDAFEQKTAKKLVYTEELEKQVFKIQ